MRVAYLGPEIPALSATFIYEELLGLERRGVAVRPHSVRKPVRSSAGYVNLAQRTRVLYELAAPASVLDDLVALLSFRRGTTEAFGGPNGSDVAPCAGGVDASVGHPRVGSTRPHIAARVASGQPAPQARFFGLVLANEG